MSSTAVALRDEQTAFDLQLQELLELEKQQKGKQPEGQLSDAEFAAEIFRNELLLSVQSLQDRMLARSHAYAVHSDWRLVEALSVDEGQAAEDRRVAEQLHVADGGGPIPPPARPVVAKRDVRFPLEDEHTDKDEEEDEDEDEDVAGSAYASPQTLTSPGEDEQEKILPTQQKKGTTANCCSCRDDFPSQEVVRLRCKHLYCIECLRMLTLNSMTDMSLFPPRCCNEPIPFHVITEHLTAQEQEDLQHKAIEYGTKNKTYCSNQQCGRFAIEVAQDRAECFRCGQSTCTLCKNAYHTAGDCPKDPDINATLQLAATQRWRRCPSCQHVVELARGCNHIICRCGHEFCYKCGIQWRKPRPCTCELWDEPMLVVSAEAVVVRDEAEGHRLAPAERQARVRQVRHHLQNAYA